MADGPAHSIDITPFLRYRPIIDDWDAFRQALERPLPAAIWTNTLRVSPDRLARLLAEDGIPLEPLGWRPGGFRMRAGEDKPGNHWGFLAGLYHVQEEISLLPVLLLDPRPGERVLDLCAAPGNKAAQAAVAMGNQGTVVANDRDFHRLRAIHHMATRLGIVNVSTTVTDGTNYPKAAGLFDRVLVDAPCTCEGTVRKNPELALDPTGGLSRRMSGGQKALLRKAIQLCRPGGRIVYSTCTHAPEESEAVVDALLRETGRGTVCLVPARVDGIQASEGLKEWDGKCFDESLRFALRIWPHQNDTGGFFVAVLEKKEGEEPHCGGMGPEAWGAAECRRVGDAPEESPPTNQPVSGPWLDPLEERFGMFRDGFAPYRLFQRTAREFRVVSRDHRPPSQPEPESTGIVFMRRQARFPKLTTAAARVFGARAARNTIELDAGQVQAYLRRQDIPLHPNQARSCTGIGYVIVRHRGIALGMALYLPDGQGKGERAKSLFPKAWCLR
jgi:NOL1/NOP2/sun family putative RNA methylase